MSGFNWNSKDPSDSALLISAVANDPAHLKINSFAKDFISNLSLNGLKSLMIFWKSLDGKFIIEENSTLGTCNSSWSGSINLNFCVLHCLISPFSNFKPK